MSTYIDGIGASQNLDTAGEIISIEGMDITSLDKSGVFNWEHLKDSPGHVVGKILKAKKIFSEKDCEDEREIYFWNKCLVPYIYVMGELFDDYKDSSKEVAGLFRYDAANEGKQEVDVVGFSIEGQYLEREGSLVKRSIARKCTITTANCNKVAIAKMVPAKKSKNNDIESIFKTEFIPNAELFIGELRKDQPKLAVASSASPKSIGSTKSGKSVFATARIHEYKGFSAQDHMDAHEHHINARETAHKAGDFKTATMHSNKASLHHGAANTLLSKPARLGANARQPNSASPGAGPNTNKLHDPQLSGKITPPGPINKAIDAGSGMAAPSQLSGGAVLAKEMLSAPKASAPASKKVKPAANQSRMNTGFGRIINTSTSVKSGFGRVIQKSQHLQRAEQEYSKWSKREEFENFMTKRMPHLTKGEIKAIGQVMALNKSITLEKALSSISGYEVPSLLAKAGEDSIFTLILFEGCELHDILHCSHFATDAMTPDTYEKIKAVCDEYFEKDREGKELEFSEAGELGKHKQKVLFLTEGNPYKDLFDKLDAVAPYKYSKFRPHISVTTNVDEFKGKAASLVISVNGEVKQKYNFKYEDKISGGLADKKKPSDFDPKSLAEGVKVESEHTSDPSIAEEIAMDHLTEDADYYKKLKIIEKK